MTDIDSLAARVQGGYGERGMTRLPKRGTPQHQARNRTPFDEKADPRDHSEANRTARDLRKVGLFELTEDERIAAESQRVRETRAREAAANTARAMQGVAVAVQAASEQMARLAVQVDEYVRGLGGLVVPPEVMEQMVKAGIVPASNPPRKRGKR